MKKIFVVNKKEGETPLEALENFRQKKSKKNKEYKDEKMTYAGRLDPMASGLLLVLSGEETKRKEKYLSLDKEYEFDVLFGFATDTYDILGQVAQKPHRQPARNVTQRDSGGGLWGKLELEKKIKQNLKHFTGKFIQKYPMYSSKTVAGRALFSYARGNEMVKIPKHEVNVDSLKFLKLKKINNKKLLENIERRIAKVKGDFRQKEILKIWHKELANSARQPARNASRSDSGGDLVGFNVVSFKIKCGSGTYVRSIANDLGEKIGIPALAFSIKRTKIGKWSKVIN